MLDETALRHPDFLPGAQIRLADGQLWTFPRPVHRDEAGAAETVFGVDYGPTVAAILEAEDEVELLRAELALAIELLGRNYRLDPEAFQELLDWRPGDPTLAEMQGTFRNVAREHARAATAASAAPSRAGWSAGRPSPHITPADCLAGPARVPETLRGQ